MAMYTLCLGSGGANDQAIKNSMYRHPGCSSSLVLKAFRSSKREIAYDSLEWLLSGRENVLHSMISMAYLRMSCVLYPAAGKM